MGSQELEELIGRVALGDRAAFNALYQATSAKLFGVALRLMKNRSEAEDVLQEAYVKIWRNAPSFHANGASASAWLVALTRNQGIDRLRARKPIAIDIDEAGELEGQEPTPEMHALAASEAATLQACLEILPPERAAAVKACYIEGYSYQELAEQNGLPLNTVRSWLRRSLIALRECLES